MQDNNNEKSGDNNIFLNSGNDIKEDIYNQKFLLFIHIILFIPIKVVGLNDKFCFIESKIIIVDVFKFKIDDILILYEKNKMKKEFNIFLFNKTTNSNMIKSKGIYI